MVVWNMITKNREKWFLYKQIFYKTNNYDQMVFLLKENSWLC